MTFYLRMKILLLSAFFAKDIFNLQSKTSKDFLTGFSNIQLMHPFEVDIRICQPENSDVHRGKAEVNITFEG